MTALTKDEAIAIAVQYAREQKLDEFEVDGAYLSDDEDGPYWRVMLGFVDCPDDLLGLPDTNTINVRVSTRMPWVIESL
jgi:hypothetical protein